ncbi:MAG: UDP binding domain-containing protein, partial [Verrucomicrobiota bacterium]
EVEKINANQLEIFLKKIRDALWVLQDKKIAVWGLAFKQNTDDIRESVAIKLIQQLLEEKAVVTAYDPKATETAKKVLGDSITYVDDPLKATEGAEALIVATEWPEFTGVDFSKVKENMVTDLIFDGRNLLDPSTMKQFGFTYSAVGRGSI